MYNSVIGFRECILLRTTSFPLSLFPGLRSRPLSASEVAGPAAQAPLDHENARPQRSEPRQGHLETRSLLPERETCRVPVRDRAECARPNKPRWRDPVYAEVSRNPATQVTQS